MSDTNASTPAEAAEQGEAGNVGITEAPREGVSEVGLDEAEAASDEASDDLGAGEERAVDREEQFRLANDVATNDAVAGETVLGEGAPLDDAPYQGSNELGGEVDLGETEDR